MGATEGPFSATTPLSEVAKTATYNHAYAQSNGFMTLVSDGDQLTGAYALGPEAGEWLQQATLAIRAKVPLEVLRDTIQPFPTFSEIYVATLKALHKQIRAARQPVSADSARRKLGGGAGVRPGSGVPGHHPPRPEGRPAHEPGDDDADGHRGRLRYQQRRRLGLPRRLRNRRGSPPVPDGRWPARPRHAAG